MYFKWSFILWSKLAPSLIKVMIAFQVQIDWEKIEQKMELEYQKERERPTAPSSTAKGKGR